MPEQLPWQPDIPIKTAQVQGSPMLRNINVLSEIEDRLQDHREKCSMTVDTLTAELEETRTLATKTNKPVAVVHDHYSDGKAA